MGRNTPELVALALFAEAIGDPMTRRDRAGDPIDLMKQRLTEHGHDFADLDVAVKAAFIDLFGDLTYEELRILGRLQAKMVELDPDQTRGLTERVEVGSHATLTKL
jgi:hypothetical protein